MPEFELKISRRDIDTLIEEIIKRDPNADIDKVKRAYKFAEDAHKDQKRLSGEPYIIHPLEVSIILARLNMDVTTITAAMLHDVVEDTITGLDTISKLFGEDVAMLVDGVTKISSLKSKSKYHNQVNSLRKLLLATTQDLRVIIIKLADKTHNMRTIQFQPLHKQQRIAQEVIDIYAPLASRLGMSKIRSELEDLAFHVIYTKEYNEVKDRVSLRKEELENYIDEVRRILEQQLANHAINATIFGRAKHYYSIFRKMIINNKEFDEIFDIRAVRIITEELKDCYAILGIVHSLWSPVPNRFKDYIAVPKSNMYQSLHTTVIGPEGHFLEIQIRTNEMHRTAEMGVAAHWAYKENKANSDSMKNEANFLQEMNKWRKAIEEANDTREFMTSLKLELYGEEIFVFTPTGELIKLPKGATPVDFAYAIHTEVGHHTTGAKVNNSMVPLKTELKSGDMVEIKTSKSGHPSETWLKFVKSSGARYKIKSWLRHHNQDQTAEPDKETREKTAQPHDKSEKIAEISLTETEMAKLKSINNYPKNSFTIEGNTNVVIKLSQCCQPIPGDEVIGFITRGRGITVHKKDCPSLKRLSHEPERFININWSRSESTYPVKLVIKANDRPGLLKDIVDLLAIEKINILKMDVGVKQKNLAIFNLIVEVKSLDHLNDIIKILQKISNIIDIHKINEKVVLK